MNTHYSHCDPCPVLGDLDIDILHAIRIDLNKI